MPHISLSPQSVRAAHSSDIVLADGWGFVSGLGPVDLDDDRTPLPEGVEAQTTKILANLDVLLRAAGLGRDNVVSVRISLTEYPRLCERMNSAYAGYFPAERLPARSCVGVLHLTRGAQVEMDFVLRTVSPP